MESMCQDPQQKQAFEGLIYGRSHIAACFAHNPILNWVPTGISTRIQGPHMDSNILGCLVVPYCSWKLNDYAQMP